MKKKYSVEERFVCSKTGAEKDCEDLVYISDKYVAVIDGATSHSARSWFGETGGRYGSKVVSQVFEKLPSDATASLAVQIMTAKLHELYSQFDMLDIVRVDPFQRISVSFAAINLNLGEIWSVGDCQYAIDGKKFQRKKAIDAILSNARAAYLASEMLRGQEISTLEQNDTGRHFIESMLQRQSLFQNNSLADEYYYPTVDGFPIPENGIDILFLSENVETIVLATDGYPILGDSLQETERLLMQILQEDPLMFKKYKSTKGKMHGYISFDDRAYVKVSRFLV